MTPTPPSDSGTERPAPTRRPPASRLSPSTEEHYQKFQRRFAAFEAQYPEGDATSRVTTFLGTLTPGQAPAARNALRRALNGAVEWDQVPRVRYTRDEVRLRATVLSAEERRLFAGLTLRERALFATLYMLRRAEVARLAWGAVNLADGTVFVRQGKGGKSAWTLLPPAALAVLCEWRAASGAPAPDQPVFPVPPRTKPRRSPEAPAPGFPLPDTVGHWAQQALKRLGLKRPGRAAHALRRTFASVFLERHPDQLARLQQLMRHAQIATTLEYVYLSPQHLRAAIEQLGL